ncbi:response regulator [Maribrevibacterium harenarium]|uniref:Response regulator n=1 Tax=Maribrevibacterium harenarium TaxID=2589817 RepID=A0A501WS23_9GAMM|nr:response regulator [Maribrevibacterium harenarium]TPE49801.1 response regulator [Maribrevibacterium harenarium]
MSKRVLICDDSGIARKQLARTLPKSWDAHVDYATNGQEAVDFIAANGVDLLFLDLNMPVLDGYQTLEALKSMANAPQVIVVSGDIQPQALERVRLLGAIDFLKKPVDSGVLQQALERHHLLGIQDDSLEKLIVAQPVEGIEKFTLSQVLQEVSNISMGRAASVLADMLNVFIKLPVPKVNILEVSELQMALSYSGVGSSRCSAVSQGYVGAGIAFEALLVFSDSSFPDMAKLLNVTDKIDRDLETELLMDVSSVLVGPYMAALGEQLNVDFSHSHPVLLGQHVQISDLINVKRAQWKRTLAVEIAYEVENYKISCDLMLLFTEDSLPVLEKLLSYLVEED